MGNPTFHPDPSGPSPEPPKPYTPDPDYTPPIGQSNMGFCEIVTSTFSEIFTPDERQHLFKVYMVLTMTTITTAFSVILQMNEILDLGIIAVICAVPVIFALSLVRCDGKNFKPMLAILLIYAFLAGQILCPLVQLVISSNPLIIIKTLVGTIVIFISLSFAALFAKRAWYLYLGGLSISLVNLMALVYLFNQFFQSTIVQISQMYMGIFIMICMTIFDTQNIMEKYRNGNQDVVQHALSLFYDVVNMFRRLLLVLSQKDDRRRTSL